MSLHRSGFFIFMNKNIFRADKNNVGDWWAPPFRYFPFSSHSFHDLVDFSPHKDEEGVFIVGGGGLGRDGFRPHLDRLTQPDRKYKLIAWGVGADLDDAEKDTTYPLGDFFDAFDEVGTRIIQKADHHHWVPCASCMHPLIEQYKNSKPRYEVGVYSHKRKKLTHKNIFNAHKKNRSFLSLNNYSVNQFDDNSGDSFEKKLAFLASHRTIITNSYHGVYWATLLGRKVICVPFKTGLHTFKHSPTYSEGIISDEAFDTARTYDNALEECRLANIHFYHYLVSKYGDI